MRTEPAAVGKDPSLTRGPARPEGEDRQPVERLGNIGKRALITAGDESGTLALNERLKERVMPKAKDPMSTAFAFFEEAEETHARSAYKHVGSILARRFPKKAAAKKTRRGPSERANVGDANVAAPPHA